MSDLLALLTDLEKNPVARQYTDGEYNLSGFAGWLEEMARPQDRTPWIHLAGTKGKGSTAALCEALLLASGLRTGLFTSPHLTHYGERFRFDGNPWSIEQFHAALETMEPHVLRRAGNQRDAPGSFRTVFEVLTALAFRSFAAEQVDAGVLETGLGGRLDCTNVVDPVVSVITPIGLDHTRILGSTVEAIAREKAGIIKPGRPVVVFDPTDEPRRRAREVILARAAEVGAPVLSPAPVECLGSYEVFPHQRVRVHWNGAAIEADLGLLGGHQARNLAVAVAAVGAFLRARGMELLPEAIRAGARDVQWAGRFEVHDTAGGRLILDGAHCPLSARALAATLCAQEGHLTRPRVLLWGMQGDKDHGAFLEALCEVLPPAWLDGVVTLRVPGPRSAPPGVLADTARRFFDRVEVAESPAEALALARAQLRPATILATGSLYHLTTIREAFLRGE